jgi:hypothetical protein
MNLAGGILQCETLHGMNNRKEITEEVKDT